MTMLSEETAVLSIREREPAGAHAAEMAKLRTSVGKAVAVLSAFQCTGGAMLGVSQVAERANLSKSTAHRILAVLVENGYVERRGARYQLGRAIFELGHLVPSCRPRRRISAMPFLTELWEYTHATVHLAILDGNDVLYLQKVHGPNSVSVPSRVGGRVPALCTALGKAILAFSEPAVLEPVLSASVPRLTSHTIVNPVLLREALERFRCTGIAEDCEGASLGIRCFAAPVFGEEPGLAVAAVSVSFATTEIVPPAVFTRLSQSAEAISTCFLPGLGPARSASVRGQA
jgi:DNA-binding IclR family transcriptional regulator